MLYRIYTENKNKTKIKNLTNKFFEGFTLLDGIGYWKNKAEKALIIEIIGNKNIEKKINLLAKKIKITNCQQAVLIQKIKNNSYFI